MTPEQEHAIQRLERLARIKEQRQMQLQAAEAALYVAVVAADELRVGKKTIAFHSGLSRQTVYTVIERAAT